MAARPKLAALAVALVLALALLGGAASAESVRVRKKPSHHLVATSNSNSIMERRGEISKTYGDSAEASKKDDQHLEDMVANMMGASKGAKKGHRSMLVTQNRNLVDDTEHSEPEVEEDDREEQAVKAQLVKDKRDADKQAKELVKENKEKREAAQNEADDLDKSQKEFNADMLAKTHAIAKQSRDWLREYNDSGDKHDQEAGAEHVKLMRELRQHEAVYKRKLHGEEQAVKKQNFDELQAATDRAHQQRETDTNKADVQYNQRQQEDASKLKAHGVALEVAHKRSLTEIKQKNEATAKWRAKMAAKVREGIQKRRAEAAQKHRAEQKSKRIEAARKRAGERKQKADARARQLYGKWCGCYWKRAFHYRGWHICKSTYFMAGLHRGRSHALSSLNHFRCCRTCKHNGRTVMRTGRCISANWWRSFDRAGWSRCPHNYYMRGLWKNSCNRIYCIEAAYCCRIRGSSGYRTCNAKGAWGRSFDRAGGSIVDWPRLMVGLYRSSGHWLYNIEYPLQCQYKQG